MAKAIQLIRAKRYGYKGKTYFSGKTEVVGDEIADYLLNQRNESGSRYFGIVKIHTVLKKEPELPDEEIIDLDAPSPEPEVIEETVEVTAEELAAADAEDSEADDSDGDTGELLEV